MADLRQALLEKLKKEQRGIKWFHSNYIESSVNPSYTTTYHQITGYIKTLSDVVIVAINKYLKD